MRILLTGSTGYIGRRLLPILLHQGHEVFCCVRDKNRFPTEGVYAHASIHLVEVDFLKESKPFENLSDIDAAYYLIHSMSSTEGDFEELEAMAAENFVRFVDALELKHVVYLSGIVNDQSLSKHLQSRKNVEHILGKGNFALTTLRAGIIVGSGSASFEIIRDLVEKLPVMVAPAWLNTLTQPIAIRNVLEFLSRVLGNEKTYNQSFDIAGPDVMNYKQMLLKFAEVRGLKRWIYTVPVMTPKLSSYWLYFVTSTSYHLAVNLVDSMKVEVVATQNQLAEMLSIELLDYSSAVDLAFQKIEHNSVVSSWKDAFVSSGANQSLLNQMEVPQFGCFKDIRSQVFTRNSDEVLENIWSIGGARGWYYGNWLWSLRGFIDKLNGGVGLRRGRTNPNQIFVGDTLDFWRVLIADRKEKRLLLYAEMKLPGEAWLEFKIVEAKGEKRLIQTATFRPKGLAGRVYWYMVLPFHGFIFSGMAKKLTTYPL